MFKVLEDLFLFYLLYKIIFDLIIPATNSTKEVKKQFADMQRKMQEQSDMLNKQQNNQYTPTNKAPFSKPDNDDYIDFEEVK